VKSVKKPLRGVGAKAVQRRAADRSRKAKSVDEYLESLSAPALSAIEKMRTAILSVVPAGATEAISYGIPAIRYKGTLVWFAAFAKHCSLFPTAKVIDAFKEELMGYATSKGTIQFPLDKPLPIALIKRLVKARLANVESQGR
jgi:uncharacterized protein YdhG (YjbR/CyaY superfamily)